MTDDFERLKAKLTETGTVTDEEITAATLTEEQRIWLNAERYDKQRAKTELITMEQYLEASKKLDAATEGTPEYAEALKIVEAYEKQA
ncbi:MAG: hypothetical protein OHK0023_13080 [Anaerolineae bacterium]